MANGIMSARGRPEPTATASELVERTVDDQDRRRNAVLLTRAGTAALERLNARADAAQDALLAALSAEERRELTRLLTRVTEPPPAR
jgi:MarR family transcriptional regulator, lower aerobic nicotinate degradation pathway regulator